VVAGLSLIAGGCCSTTQQVTEAMQRLELKNRTREEPALRMEAARRGAELLPNLPEIVEVPPDCDRGPGPLDWRGELNKQWGICARSSEGVLRIFVKNQETRLVIPVPGPFLGPYSQYTARLARRGSHFVVLQPRGPLPRAIGTLKECECGCPSRGWFPTTHGFVLDDVESADFEQVEVPVTQAAEYYEHECKACLM
jgi:hypothetical protein